MGNIFGALLERLWGTQQYRVLILGLDAAGKTTILYRLAEGRVVSTVPTIGFNMENVSFGNVKFQCWDLGGQTSIRPYWRFYYRGTNAVIFVVDSADLDRLCTARDELHLMLDEEELKYAALLVFANKQDLPLAATEAQVSEALRLSNLTSRSWAIFRSSATKGYGIIEGMDWLTNTLKTSRV